MAVFVLQNDNGSMLTRGSEWSWDITPQTAFATPHRDAALNQLLELNIKDPHLRARVISCPLDERKLPILPPVEKPQRSLIEDAASPEAPVAEASVAS